MDFVFCGRSKYKRLDPQAVAVDRSAHKDTSAKADLGGYTQNICDASGSLLWREIVSKCARRMHSTRPL